MLVGSFFPEPPEAAHNAEKLLLPHLLVVAAGRRREREKRERDAGEMS